MLLDGHFFASYNDIALFLIRNGLYIDIKIYVLFLNLPLNSIDRVPTDVMSYSFLQWLSMK